MSKYIVKNCPAYLGADCVGFGNGGCDICTDCRIKQVIEKCNIYKNFVAITISDYAKRELALHILDLFDIEEVK